MDPRACLEILAGAARQHAGQAAPGGACCGVSGAFAGGLVQGSGADLQPAILADVDAASDSEEDTCMPCGAPQEGERTRHNAGGIGGGQVIDLATGDNETVDLDLTEAALLELFPALGPCPDCEGAASPSENEAPADLVAAVVKLHEARVSVHKAYDAAFKHLLASKIGGTQALRQMYPFVVSCVTARFKALSESVRKVAAILEEAAQATGAEESISEAATLIRKLQSLEQARLQIVASHHVEQSRLLSPNSGSKESCLDIQRRLGAASEAIEETVSELRYCAADLRS